MVDVPDGGLEDISEVIIYGVESEQIEEENDAYNDLRAELGIISFHILSCIQIIRVQSFKMVNQPYLLKNLLNDTLVD